MTALSRASEPAAVILSGAKDLAGNYPMYSRKLRVEYEAEGRRLPCPMKWLDSFAMRNFTNAQQFDDTLPVADGRMEIGARVPLQELKSAMEEWFRKKSYLPKDARLWVTEPTDEGARL